MTTACTLRRFLRVGVVTAPLASVLLASPAVAATPVTWGDPDPMSVLEALLIFAGIPLAIIFGVTLLVLAPSLVRGDRQQRGVSSWTEPQWFGGHTEAVSAGRSAPHGEIGVGEHAERAEQAEDTEEPAGAESGGASARW